MPTEAEWEKAARGGFQIPSADGDLIDNPEPNRIYPWGDQSPSCDLGAQNGANYFTCPYDAVLTPASFRAHAYGLFDMAGNVWEWTADWYEKEAYQSLIENQENPTGPERSTGKRVVRGGSWDDLIQEIRVTNRNRLSPGESRDDVGFRCAQSP